MGVECSRCCRHDSNDQAELAARCVSNEPPRPNGEGQDGVGPASLLSATEVIDDVLPGSPKVPDGVGEDCTGAAAYPNGSEIIQLVADMRLKEALAKTSSLKDAVPSSIIEALHFQDQLVHEAVTKLKTNWWKSSIPSGQTEERWTEGGESCYHFRITDNCDVKLQLQWVGSYQVMGRAVIDDIPIPACTMLAILREVALWPLVVDSRKTWNMKSEHLRDFAPNDNLVRMTYKLPLPMMPHTEVIMNRAYVDMLGADAKEFKSSFGPGFMVLEIDPVANKEGLWRGGPLPKSSNMKKEGRKASYFVELAPNGVRLHAVAKVDLPVPSWLLPASALSMVLRSLFENAYNQMMEIAWRDVDDCKVAFDKRMKEQADLYARFRERTTAVRQQMGWPSEIEVPYLAPLPSGKCSRSGCKYQKHTKLGNNGGTHCCKSCMLYNRHGLFCQKQIYQPNGHDESKEGGKKQSGSKE